MLSSTRLVGCCAALFLLLGAPSLAGAATYLFTGTVTVVNDPGGHLSVAVNDGATGYLRWNTGMTQIFSGTNVAYYQESVGMPGTLGVTTTVGGVTYRNASGANVTLQVHDDNATFHDRLSISDASLTNTGGLSYAASGSTAILLDEDETVFSSTAIPSSLPGLGPFESATVTVTLTNIDSTSDSASVTIDLTSLTAGPPAGVPAAAPLALASLALLLLGAGWVLRPRAG